MSNRRLYLIVSLLLTVMFGLASFVHYKTKNIDRFRPRMIQVLKHITGHPVSIKKIRYAPLSGLFTMELQELEVLADDPAEPPMLQVPDTLLSFSAVSLLFGKPRLSAIKLIRPQINIVLRDHTPLMERAQDTALASDEKLLQELGFGLTDLSIGHITVQNGILAILDWDHPEGRTWVMDHLQLGIHALSPTQPSPTTASARYRSIPFTVNGQIGPLPDTLNPFSMPILLSLEAKSVVLNDMQEILSTETIKITTSRGYLTSLLHGSLNTGLQTSTWLQLDGVTLTRKGKLAAKQPQKKVTRNLLERFSNRNEKNTLDIALRQKSIIDIDWKGIPNVEFEEFFIYLDGSPIFETKGSIRGSWHGPMQLDVKLLNSVDLERFPWPIGFPFKGNSPSGSFKLKGDFPSEILYSADLDLTNTTINMPPLEKSANIPLAIKFAITQAGDKINITNALISHPTIPDHTARISGALTPAAKLKTTVSWDIGNLSNYFPIAKQWDSKALTKLQMEFSDAAGTFPWRAKGKFTVAKGSFDTFVFQDLRIPFEIRENRLYLPHLEMMAAGGRIEGLVMADLSQSPIIFDSRLTLAGTDLAILPGSESDTDDDVKLDGYLFAQASLQGQLDEESLLPTTNHLAGHTHIRIEPGGVIGIDQSAFYKKPTTENVISNPKKSLYWNRLEADINLLNEQLTLEDINIESGETKITGSGLWDFIGNRSFELKVQTDWRRDTKNEQFSINVEGDAITHGFRIKPRAEQTKTLP
ncbi:MAG: DUF748 domain-containing protein [Magnetococcales bacterium]|nr:DUF748 domain-containing protein [Magnetococcales bacterium]